MAELHALPVAIVLGIAVLIGCCATVCFCVCSGVKGAYDDLAVLSSSPEAAEPLLAGTDENDEYDHLETIPPETDEIHQETAEETGGTEAVVAREESVVSAVQEGEETGENQPTPDENITDTEDPASETNEESPNDDGTESDPVD